MRQSSNYCFGAFILRIYRTEQAWPSLTKNVYNKKIIMRKYMVGQKMPKFFFASLFVFTSLSIVSCSDDDDNITIEPYAEHSIKGVAQNQEGTAIPAIQIIVKSDHSGWKNDTIKTDDKGEYIKKYKLTGNIDVNYNIIFRDIDGDKNGSFQTDSVKVTFKKEDLKEGNGVFLGSAIKEANLTLKVASK